MEYGGLERRVRMQSECLSNRKVLYILAYSYVWNRKSTTETTDMYSEMCLWTDR